MTVIDTTTAVGGNHPGDAVTMLGSWRSRGRADRAGHLAHHGPLPELDEPWRARFLDDVERSGLTGRGGAGFPSAAKLRWSMRQRRPPLLVVNAMEGEPASHKDQVLLQCVPHLVVDGASMAAVAVGAAAVVICVADTHRRALASLRQAVAEREPRERGLASLDVVTAPKGFVVGEESALIGWLSERDARPRFRPDKAVALAVGGRPALVLNTETVAQLGLIGRYGAVDCGGGDAAARTGTTLVTISGAVRHGGVFEVRLGTPIRPVVHLADPSGEPQAVLVGGYGGTWVGPSGLGAPFSPGGLLPLGAAPGSGVLVVVGPEACGLQVTARLAGFLAQESVGQCGPCVFGLPAIAADLTTLAGSSATVETLTRLRTRLGTVEGRGACRHPDGAARMVRSALTVFAGDVERHLARGGCGRRGSSRPAHS